MAACISGFPAFAENDGKREVRKEHKEAVAYSIALLVLQACSASEGSISKCKRIIDKPSLTLPALKEIFLSVLSPAPLSPSRMRRSILLAACISGFPAFAENDGKREVRKAAATKSSCLPSRF